MERGVVVLTAAAIPTTATGLGLIVGALVSLWVGVGAALIVVGATLWLLASALTAPRDIEAESVEPPIERPQILGDLVQSADISIADPEGEPEVGVARLYQALR